MKKAEETMKKNILILWTGLAILYVPALFGPNNLFAHCDGMDGPVVTAAKQALDKGDVTPVLKWEMMGLQVAKS